MDVQCALCPKGCIIAPGQSGECRIRVNVDGKLVAVTYGHPCSVHVDPVEKKPLFHFLPGTGILSLATVGCNLHCKNCQNWEISQANPEDYPGKPFPPALVAQAAREYDCRSVAYTYTEPLVYYEYTLDTCMAVREAGLKNALVTAGYINEEPMARLCPYVDAGNIDLKSISDAFYRDVCDATLAPVQRTLVQSKSLGVWVEVTNLVIPTLNDTDADLRGVSRWIAENLGRDTPLHFSRFYPQYRMKNLPPTPENTLERAKEIARAEGLYFVYIGNVARPGGEDTHCPGCGVLLVERRGYTVRQNRMEGGACPECGTPIAGIWT
ncbi:MAG TPA: AmmeMemoRadiSam system radical SAM enzyme [Candidatus Hydrogenedentes bacterium]|nr:AmmeMemoRadiSam system radical SAM enzyme [Candidatus Hydrogenedentota bacterium]HPG65882.1 AmmeMemoRadiSam system radical SAM enzyme [Candidatus Hydrogenedentota bacterium]